MRVLQEKVPADKVLTILNTQYAIFLGLFIQFLFSVQPSTAAPKVDVLLRPENQIPVILWATYLLCDWLTSNLTVALKSQVNHLYLIALIALVTLLGSMPILAIDPNLRFYCLSAFYLMLVPLWDLCLPLEELTRSSGERLYKSPTALLLVTLMMLRLGCAAVFLAVLIAHVGIGANTINLTLLHWFYVFMGVYLLLKLVRYFVYMDLGARTRAQSEMQPR